MTKLKIELPTYHCCRCDYNWKARKLDIPVQCPQCRSPYWNIAPEGFEKKANGKLSSPKSEIKRLKKEQATGDEPVA